MLQYMHMYVQTVVVDRTWVTATVQYSFINQPPPHIGIDQMPRYVKMNEPDSLYQGYKFY